MPWAWRERRIIAAWGTFQQPYCSPLIKIGEGRGVEDNIMNEQNPNWAMLKIVRNRILRKFSGRFPLRDIKFIYVTPKEMDVWVCYKDYTNVRASLQMRERADDILLNAVVEELNKVNCGTESGMHIMVRFNNSGAKWDFISSVERRILEAFSGQNILYRIDFLPINLKRIDGMVFYRTDEELARFNENGTSFKIKDLVYKELDKINRGPKSGSSILLVFDSDENVQKNYRGSYYLRLLG